MALPDNTLLNNRYRILGQLGQGGMGAVYHAMDESLGVEVAVKENKIDDEDYNRQFKREAKIMANMRHPNMPRVTDHFITDDGQYLVMDFVEGEDLRSRLERAGEMEEKEVILIGSAICDALNYLHNQDPPILHRDIKPGNIKVTPSGHVFLVDFGLAKVGPSSQQTTTGARGLTPGYSPPEQYGSARTDQRSDIYALGATLYALLTATPPEDGLSIAIQQSTLTAITEHKPTTTQRLAQVIEKALDVQPEKRYQNAYDFKKALLEASDTINQQVAMGEVTIAPPPPSAFKGQIEREDTPVGSAPPPAQGTQLSKPAGSAGGPNWLLFGGIGGGLLILLLAALFILPRLFGGGGNNVGETPTAGEATEAPVVVGEPTDEVIAVEEPTEEPIAEVVTGPQIAYASDRSGEPQIYLLTLDSDEDPVQLTEIGGGACQPDWSPDGALIVFISPCNGRSDQYATSSLWLLDVVGGGAPQRLNSQAGDFHPIFSPDGTRILFTSLRENNSPRLFMMDVESGSVERLEQPNTQNIMATFSPDGNFLAFVLNGQIWVMNLETQVERAITESSKSNSFPDWSPDGRSIIFMQGSPPYVQAVNWSGDFPAGGLTSADYRLVTDAIPMRDGKWSTDGSSIIFSSNVGGDGSQHDIYIVPSSGSGATKLTNDSFFDFHPVWRP
jgi:hypothetical protein